MSKSIEEVVATGDLSGLTPEQKDTHYRNTCKALGLDARLHPLEFVFADDVNGGRRLILYMLRNGTDQLRKIHGIKMLGLTHTMDGDIITYTATAQDKSGQQDISTGSVSLKGKSGQDRANAMMAAETKAKRRVTLSITGSGLLDETEIADMSATVTAPGIGVSAAPAIASPTPATTIAREVTPEPAAPSPTLAQAPEPAEPAQPKEPITKESVRKRFTEYKRDHLSHGGMRPQADLPIPAKLSKFILLQIPGGKTRFDEATPEEINFVFDRLDAIRAQFGDREVVEHIEDTLLAAGGAK